MRIKIDPLDKIFSEFIRRRAILRVGGCEKCLRPKYDITKDNGDIFPAWRHLEVSHFYGRGRKSIRWDEDNSVGLCFKCHQEFGAQPLEHVRWFEKYIGKEASEMLAGRERVIGKPDKSALMLYYSQKIKEMI